MASSSTNPLPNTRLNEIANKACDSTFQSANGYNHFSTESWNSNIINSILQALVDETSSAGRPPAYKFAVNSTLVQNSHAPSLNGTGATETSEADDKGKRGLHSAAGAFWNSEKDGMWTFKYEKSEAKGFDVVISVIWISLS